MHPALRELMHTPVRFRARQPATSPKGGHTWAAAGPARETSVQYATTRRESGGTETKTRSGICWLDPADFPAPPAAGDLIVLPGGAEAPVLSVESLADETGAVDHYEITFGAS